MKSTEPRSWRGLGGVLGAQAASLSANRMLAIAVPWLVLTTTGSAAKTGLIVFCQITPYVVVQALTGPLIDRIGPRRVSIAGDAVSASAMLAAPLLLSAHELPLWGLMALMAAVGAADGPASGAKSVFIPSVTRAAGISLERGTGLTTAIERTATAIGPAAAGVVVATLGAPSALWVAAIMFGLSAVVTAVTLADPQRDPDEAANGQTESYLARLRQGATFLRRERLLRAMVGMLVATNLLDQGFFSVLLPVWVRDSHHGAATVGLVVSIFGATSIAAALTAAALSERLPRRLVYMTGFLIGGIPRFIVMALGAPVWGVLAIFAIGGLGSGFINPVIGAVVYERIPGPLLGRVRTLTTALSWAGIPFGGLFAAGVIAVAGITGALWVVGACYLAAIVLPGLRPEWSAMRQPEPPPAPPSVAPALASSKT